MTRMFAILARELREALPAFVFFLIAFHMIELTKAVVLTDYRITPSGTGMATVGALIVAKAILVVDKIPLARLFSARRIENVLWKTLLFGAVTVVFRVLEEFLPVIARQEQLGHAVERLRSDFSWPHFWVVQMWLFALLFQFTLATELIRSIGSRSLRDRMLGPSSTE